MIPRILFICHYITMAKARCYKAHGKNLIFINWMIILASSLYILFLKDLIIQTKSLFWEYRLFHQLREKFFLSAYYASGILLHNLGKCSLYFIITISLIVIGILCIYHGENKCLIPSGLKQTNLFQVLIYIKNNKCNTWYVQFVWIYKYFPSPITLIFQESVL